MKLSIQDVRPEDRGVLGPCGIVCLGCDFYRDESLEAAKILVKVWEGFNMRDVSPGLGLESADVAGTLNTLRNYIKIKEELGHCLGCSVGAIGPCANCPIVDCAKTKGYWTCAECDDFRPDSESPCPHVEAVSNPFESKGAMFAMVCKRYSRNNLDNLKRCQEIGYPEFIAEVKEKTKNGWRTYQVISREMLLQGKIGE